MPDDGSQKQVKEQPAVPYLNARTLGIQGSNQAHENDGADHAAQPAFHRLSGTDDRRQLMGAHRSPNEIRPHIIDRAAQRDKDQNGKPLRPPPNFHRAVEEYGKHQCTGQDTPKADGMNLFHAAHKQRERHNGKHPYKQKDLRVIWKPPHTDCGRNQTQQQDIVPSAAFRGPKQLNNAHNAQHCGRRFQHIGIAGKI